MNGMALLGACLACIVDGFRSQGREYPERQKVSKAGDIASTVKSSAEVTESNSRRSVASTMSLPTLLFALSCCSHSGNGVSDALLDGSSGCRKRSSAARRGRAFHMSASSDESDMELRRREELQGELDEKRNAQYYLDPNGTIVLKSRPLLNSFMDDLRKEWAALVSKLDDGDPMLGVEELAVKCIDEEGCSLETIEEQLERLKLEKNPNVQLVETILRLEEQLGRQQEKGGLRQAFQDPEVNQDRRKLIGLAILSLGDDLLAVGLAGGGASKVPGLNRLARLLGYGDKIDDVALAQKMKIPGRQRSKFRRSKTF